jgi:hypothetical protein
MDKKFSTTAEDATAWPPRAVFSFSYKVEHWLMIKAIKKQISNQNSEFTY